MKTVSPPHPSTRPLSPLSCRRARATAVVLILALQHAWPMRPHSPSPHPTHTCALSPTHCHPPALLPSSCPAHSDALVRPRSPPPHSMCACTVGFGLYYIIWSVQVCCDFNLSKYSFLYNPCLCSISCVVDTQHIYNISVVQTTRSMTYDAVNDLNI